jgi:UDPglucose 6-dehydrogenase
LVHAAIHVNEELRRTIVRRVVAAIPADTHDPVVAMWGLTYKAGTDDIRDSPARAIINDLRDAGVTVQAYDPTRSEPIAGITVCADEYEACRNAVVLVVATEWPEFARADFALIRASMSGSAVIDTRNILDATLVRAAGLHYSGMGTRSEALATRDEAATATPSLAAVPH